MSRQKRRCALWTAGVVALSQLGPLLSLERRMKRTGGPGIIRFELAGTTANAEAILDAWGEEGRAAATRSLLLDYPFPASYALLHGLGCAAAADAFATQGRPWLAGAGPPLAWTQLAAAGFDYIENTALLLILSGRDGRLPALARRAALIKFGLLSAGWIYVLFAAASSVRSALALVTAAALTSPAC